MFKAFASVADSDDVAIESSTAPTTPDGSLTFSPVLQAAQLLDALEGGASGAGAQPRTARGSSATLDLDGTAPMAVKNICCVGAGYVGKSSKSLCLNIGDSPSKKIQGLRSGCLNGRGRGVEASKLGPGFADLLGSRQCSE
jgi:hypothetical protein